MSALGFTKDRFVAPATDADDLIAEGIMNRVLRVTEEAGKLSEDIAVEYGFDRHAVTGVRNRLAHAYGEVDRDIFGRLSRKTSTPCWKHAFAIAKTKASTSAEQWGTRDFLRVDEGPLGGGTAVTLSCG